MKITGDKVLVLVLLGALVGILVFALPRVPTGDMGPPYSTYSDHATGAWAFYGLLESFPFKVQKIQTEPYGLPDDLSALFLLQPIVPLDEDVLTILQGFVKGGGTLIIAATTGVESLLSDYGLKMVPLGEPLHISEPITRGDSLGRNPVPRFPSATRYAIRSETREVTPLFGRGSDYSVVTFREEQGRVVVLSCPAVFTRAGLEQQENAAFIYSLLTSLPLNASVGVDEYHHGFRESVESQTNPQAALLELVLGSSVGWAVIYLGVLSLVFLLLQGRRMGQPVESQNQHRRASTEYVLAMSYLYQKGKKRDAIRKAIRDTFRRQLAHRWHLDPNLETSRLVAEVAKRQAVAADALEGLLLDLDSETTLSETQLLSLAQRVEATQTSIERG